eukprot:TRINITY_DN7531_c0_g1_i2.p1 TRINITY_DN7531_c0_g1~~TRINITY_DN7531_c0_g1_i2.p1  ORF type:complete len:288 (-),score=9.03 TRINITY_DN7531_c0_g1_i2:38-901(-)
MVEPLMTTSADEEDVVMGPEPSEQSTGSGKGRKPRSADLKRPRKPSFSRDDSPGTEGSVFDERTYKLLSKKHLTTEERQEKARIISSKMAGFKKYTVIPDPLFWFSCIDPRTGWKACLMEMAEVRLNVAMGVLSSFEDTKHCLFSFYENVVNTAINSNYDFRSSGSGQPCSCNETAKAMEKMVKGLINDLINDLTSISRTVATDARGLSKCSVDSLKAIEEKTHQIVGSIGKMILKSDEKSGELMKAPREFDRDSISDFQASGSEREPAPLPSTSAAIDSDMFNDLV